MDWTNVVKDLERKVVDVEVLLFDLGLRIEYADVRDGSGAMELRGDGSNTLRGFTDNENVLEIQAIPEDDPYTGVVATIQIERGDNNQRKQIWVCGDLEGHDFLWKTPTDVPWIDVIKSMVGEMKQVR